ncbi:HAD family hydrolase [Bifidobacterium sp. 82T10]|uniref:HAD family hydrolase n=1 Tax=Bifidobacterium miconis TaxID=2834435 RepID=A0ABS6WE66_9BIFI|nr:HAD family hydrolase [Bifidobacterium miconis]MBW3092328.1 HAD family hydrolase [Bifidobacterium miconis]
MSLKLPILVVTDLDGTLLNENGQVSSRLQDMLGRANNAGVLFAAASARPLRLVKQVLGPVLPLFSALFASNGAQVVDTAACHVIHSELLDERQCAGIIAMLKSRYPQAGFGWEYREGFGCDQAFWDLRAHGGILRDPDSQRISSIPNAPVLELVMATPGYKADQYINGCHELIGKDFTVTDSSGGVMEISNAHANKAYASQIWAKSLGAGLRNVIAFGDGLNDVPLLRAAGMGVAMANADERIKAAADAIAPSNQQDGVGVFLTNLLRDEGLFA